MYLSRLECNLEASGWNSHFLSICPVHNFISTSFMMQPSKGGFALLRDACLNDAIFVSLGHVHLSRHLWCYVECSQNAGNVHFPILSECNAGANEIDCKCMNFSRFAAVRNSTCVNIFETSVCVVLGLLSLLGLYEQCNLPPYCPSFPNAHSWSLYWHTCEVILTHFFLPCDDTRCKHARIQHLWRSAPTCWTALTDRFILHQRLLVSSMPKNSCCLSNIIALTLLLAVPPFY